MKIKCQYCQSEFEGTAYDTICSECAFKIALNKKKNKRKIIISAIVCLLAVLLVCYGAIFIPNRAEFQAVKYEISGNYLSARVMYQDLGNKEKADEMLEKYVRKLRDEGRSLEAAYYLSQFFTYEITDLDKTFSSYSEVDSLLLDECLKDVYGDHYFAYEKVGALKTGGTISCCYYKKDENTTIRLDWIILGKSGKTVKLMCATPLDAMAYDSTDESVSWADSELRAWLNNDFLSKCYWQENAYVAPLSTMLLQTDASTYDENQLLVGERVLDYVTLPTKSDCEHLKCEKINVNFEKLFSDRNGEFTNSPSWLRNPSSEKALFEPSDTTEDYVAWINFSSSKLSEKHSIHPIITIQLLF